MVTTIRITCDGVFIQSNSFLTTSSASSSATTTITTPTPTADSNSTSSGDTPTSNNSRRTITSTDSSTPTHSEKDRSESASLDYEAKHQDNPLQDARQLSGNESDNSHRKSSSPSSITSTLNSRNLAGSPSNRAKRPRTPKSDNRRRYYFGNNKIYWCKQAILSTATPSPVLSVNRKNDSSVLVRSKPQITLSRSASSVTDKELQQHRSGTKGGLRSHKPLTATNSLSAVTLNSNVQKFNLKEFYTFNNKINQSAINQNANNTRTSSKNSRNTKYTATPKTISGGTSIFLVNGGGFSISSSAYATKNSASPTDTRLLSFLRSARKLYRNSIRLNHVQSNVKINPTDDENATKDDVDSSSKNPQHSSALSDNNIPGDSVSPAKRDKLRQSYIFGITSFLNGDNNEKTSALSEEWFG